MEDEVMQGYWERMKSEMMLIMVRAPSKMSTKSAEGD